MNNFNHLIFNQLHCKVKKILDLMICKWIYWEIECILLPSHLTEHFVCFLMWLLIINKHNGYMSTERLFRFDMSVCYLNWSVWVGKVTRGSTIYHIEHALCLLWLKFDCMALLGLVVERIKWNNEWCFCIKSENAIPSEVPSNWKATVCALNYLNFVSDENRTL